MKVKTPAWMESIIEAARTAHFYIIAQPGPLVFVLKERDSDNTVKVSLGSPHVCTCDGGSRTNYCIHISFLLQRKYQLPADHPWIAQTSLTNTDIESLLQLRHLDTRKSRHPGHVTTTALEDQQTRQDAAASTLASGSQSIRSRNPITELDSCPICLDGFIDSDDEEINYSALPFCSNCGNSLHSRCIQLFHQHAKQTKSKEICPYCKSLYEDGRKYYLATLSSTDKTKSVEKPLRICSRCELKLESTSIKRVFGQEQYCSACFITLNSGMYKKKTRRILLRTKQEDHNTSKERALAIYRRFASIQYREITSEDYNLLLELENPYMIDISKKPQRFPSYLIWNCFKQRTCKEDRLEDKNCICFLCGHYYPTFSSLLIEKENQLPTDAAITETPSIGLNVDSITTLLLEQGEQVVSSAALQELQEKNVYLDLPCLHVVHKLCAILGSLLCKPEAIFTTINEQNSCDLSDYKVKMFPDYCTTCKTPYLSEWIRGSKLAPKQQQKILPPLKSSSEQQITHKIALKDQLPEMIDNHTLSITGIPISNHINTKATQPLTQSRTSGLVKSKSVMTKQLKKSTNNQLSVNIPDEQPFLPMCKSSPYNMMAMGVTIKPVT